MAAVVVVEDCVGVLVNEGGAGVLVLLTGLVLVGAAEEVEVEEGELPALRATQVAERSATFLKVSPAEPSVRSNLPVELWVAARMEEPELRW